MEAGLDETLGAQNGERTESREDRPPEIGARFVSDIIVASPNLHL
jgi:hypothetical protein